VFRIAQDGDTVTCATGRYLDRIVADGRRVAVSLAPRGHSAGIAVAAPHDYGIVMRTVVDLPDDHVRELAELSKRRNQSRASLVREAVAIYLEARKRGNKDKAFGLWQPKGADGIAYQRKVRAEW
jgi:hypothetical protein